MLKAFIEQLEMQASEKVDTDIGLSWAMLAIH